MNKIVPDNFFSAAGTGMLKENLHTYPRGHNNLAPFFYIESNLSLKYNTPRINKRAKNN